MASERKINGAVSFEDGKVFTNETRAEFDAHLKGMKKADRDAAIKHLSSAGAIGGYQTVSEESLSADPTILAGQKVPARSAGHEGELDLDGEDEAPAPTGPVHREASAPEGAAKGYGHEGEKGRGGKK